MKKLIFIIVPFLFLGFFACSSKDNITKANKSASKVDPEKIYQVVAEMPSFPDCENKASTADRRTCTQEKLIDFISKNIKYPTIARENSVEGVVITQFIVEKDGTLSGLKIIRNIGAECGKEALRILNLVNKNGLKWTPGKHMDQDVRVQYNLPVRFKLD